MLKFFLHVSKDEQRKRFLKRLEDPRKHWKFSAADLAERGFWDDYMKAYEEAIGATSTKWAPWYIIPADHKWVTRGLVARILVSAIERARPPLPRSDAPAGSGDRSGQEAARGGGLGSVAISAIFRRISHTPSSRPSQWGQPGRVLCPAHPPPAPSSECVASPVHPPTPLRRSAWRCPVHPPYPPFTRGHHCLGQPLSPLVKGG